MKLEVKQCVICGKPFMQKSHNATVCGEWCRGIRISNYQREKYARKKRRNAE